MEKIYTLYVGLNDKDTHTQKIGTIEAYKLVENIICQFTNGATIYEARGIYKHEDGTITYENTLRVELMFIDIENVYKIIDTLKISLNQESIALQTQNIDSKLI